MNISQYIKKILYSDNTTIESWGICNIHPIENGLEFSVNGFIHQGEVRVIYNEQMDDFTILIVKDGKIINRTDGIFFDELVETIDHYVEFDGDEEKYRKMVMSVYGLS